MKTLRLNRAALQKQLSEIDLDAMQHGIDLAQRASDEFQTVNVRRMSLPDVLAESTRLRGCAAQLVLEHGSAQRDADRLQRELDRLDAMIGAETCIKATTEALGIAQAGVATAQSERAKAEAVLDQVSTLLTAETAVVESLDDQAVEGLLGALASGASPKPATANHSTLEILVRSKARAEAALAGAQSTAAEAQATLNTCTQALRLAESYLTERTMVIAARSFATALVQHQDSCHAARAHFDAPDVDQLARDVRRASDPD